MPGGRTKLTVYQGEVEPVCFAGAGAAYARWDNLWVHASDHRVHRFPLASIRRVEIERLPRASNDSTDSHVADGSRTVLGAGELLLTILGALRY